LVFGAFGGVSGGKKLCDSILFFVTGTGLGTQCILGKQQRKRKKEGHKKLGGRPQKKKISPASRDTCSEKVKDPKRKKRGGGTELAGSRGRELGKRGKERVCG